MTRTTAPSERYHTRNVELFTRLLSARASDDTLTVRRITEEIIVANDALVRHAAHRFNHSLPRDEAYAAARLGLLHAISRFDPSRGNTIATYAMWWMRKFIQNAVLENAKHLEHRADLPAWDAHGGNLPCDADPDDEVLSRLELDRLLGTLTQEEHRALLRSAHHPLKRQARSKLVHPANSDLAGEWTAAAACKGTPLQQILHPRQASERLGALCASCPVLRSCALFAARRNPSGWWAGTHR